MVYNCDHDYTWVSEFITKACFLSISAQAFSSKLISPGVIGSCPRPFLKFLDPLVRFHNITTLIEAKGLREGGYPERNCRESKG